MEVGGWRIIHGMWIVALGIGLTVLVPSVQAQSTQNQQQHPANPSQDIPDAPSAVQPPPPKVPSRIMSDHDKEQLWSPRSEFLPAQHLEKPPQPSANRVERTRSQDHARTVLQTGPRNQLNPRDDLYRILVTTNFVHVPVMVKDRQGQLVYGLLPKDFIVKENGQPQTLTFFSSDPFQLSVAIVLDLGMADVAVQKVNQTYSSLVGAFSPYDEFALYTYSSVATQVMDFTGRADRLSTVLDSMKSVRGYNNGPPVLGGPLGPQPPMINGVPVGTAAPPPVFTPPREAHVLNDAILRAALDLSKRDSTRRKVIFVISNGLERGSQSTFKQVTKVLQTQGIQVKAIVVDQGALPIYKEMAKLHDTLWKAPSDILAKYARATGGGTVFDRLSRLSIEDAYAEVTSEARNQYTLGYNFPGAGGGPYRTIEVIVDQKNLKVYAKDGYYPAPAAH